MVTVGWTQAASLAIRRDFNSDTTPIMKTAVALAVRTKLPTATDTKHKLLKLYLHLEQFPARRDHMGYALCGRPSNARPLVALAISELFFTLSQILRVTVIVNLFAEGMGDIALDKIVGAQIVLDGIAYAAVVAATMFTLWNRGAAASRHSTPHPPRASLSGITFKQAWDIVFLITLACMAIGRATVSVQAGYFSDHYYYS